MLIGLDIGSSSAKAILVDAYGRLRRSARVRFPTSRAAGGRVEHDPQALLRASIAALSEAAAGIAPSGSASLGIATQRSTILFWDRDSGRSVTPAYSWQDLRAAGMCRQLLGRRAALSPSDRDVGATVAKRTGLRISAHYAAAKLAWALRRVPGLRRRAAGGRVLWGTLGSWIAWHLTRGGLYAIDHANAQRTLLFDLGSLAWDPTLFELFGLLDLYDLSLLPALVPTQMESGTEVGAGGRRLFLRAMTGDQQAALQGMLCRRSGDMAINYGSGAFVLTQVGSAPVRVPGLLTTLVSSRHLLPGETDRPGACAATFAVEGTVNAAATALDWVGRRLGRRIRIADLDGAIGPYDPSIRRLAHFLPAVSGLGAPRWDERARPRFAGVADGATPRDLVRAAVESIAQRCAEIAAAAEVSLRRTGATGRNADSADRPAVRVSGGLTRCRYLLQAQADLLQRPMVVAASRDATALGAARLARENGGTRTLTGAGGGQRPQEVVRPIASPALAAALRREWTRAVYDPASGASAASRRRRTTKARSRKARNQPARGPFAVPRKAR